MTRYNTTLGYIEWYDASGSTWRAIYQSPSINVEYLVVAGGGGGGGGAQQLLTVEEVELVVILLEQHPAC
jgi:hypothetical protein